MRKKGDSLGIRKGSRKDHASWDEPLWFTPRSGAREASRSKAGRHPEVEREGIQKWSGEAFKSGAGRYPDIEWEASRRVEQVLIVVRCIAATRVAGTACELRSSHQPCSNSNRQHLKPQCVSEPPLSTKRWPPSRTTRWPRAPSTDIRNKYRTTITPDHDSNHEIHHPSNDKRRAGTILGNGQAW